MKKWIHIISALFLFNSCTNKFEDSNIEVIKYDEKLVNRIITNADTTYKEILKEEDFWSIEYYLIDSTEYKIMKDSLGNISAIIQSINGILYSGKEFFPNGQLKGKTNFPPGKIVGEATYYYEDGRIRSKGLWKDYKQIGEWYNYNMAGKLKFIEQYDNNGQLLKKEEI